MSDGGELESNNNEWWRQARQAVMQPPSPAAIELRSFGSKQIDKFVFSLNESHSIPLLLCSE